MMTARWVSVSLASSLAATLGCSPPAASNGDDETGVDASSDTGSSADSCVEYGLTPNRAYSGVSLATLMFPESRGGTHRVAGSCGGGGVEEGTLVTAPETAYYYLWAHADQTLVYHVHQGDSCSGPEIACEHGPSFGIVLMLEAGESVVVVADTEPEQVIPESGLAYSVGVDFTTPPPRPCQMDEFEACSEAPIDALGPCMAGYECGDFETFALCNSRTACERATTSSAPTIPTIQRPARQPASCGVRAAIARTTSASTSGSCARTRVASAIKTCSSSSPSDAPGRNRATPARHGRQPVVTTSNRKQRSAARRAANRAKGEKRTYPRVRARPIRAGRTYKITRRCIERRMFFAPDVKAKVISDFVGYCLAHAATVYGIQVHACVFMSNHHHTDVTDPDGKLIEFKQLFHSMLARGINTLRGRFDAVWSRDKPCDTRRAEDDETLADLAYTLANPVTAGLVKWGNLWTGFTTYGWCFGETRTFTRPKWFFDRRGEMPETAELTLSRPPIYRDLDDEQMFERLMDAVRTAERTAQRRLHREHRRFMGGKKLVKQHWNRAPRSFEERFTQAPTVAASSKWLVLAELQRDREWERAYAMAREKLLAGGEATFPVGTYWLRRFAGVTVGEHALL